MADSLLLNFKHHPEERKAIADLILAYGDLESSLLNLLQAALNGDTYTAVRAMYRVRSESNRLEIVDALVTPRLAEQKLDGAWGEAYAAMKCCMGIRNRYAHSQWLHDDGELRFGNLDEAANKKGPKCKIVMLPLSAGVLTEQRRYFEYAHHQINWIGDRYRLATDQKRLTKARIPKPKRISPPRLDSRGEARPRRLSSQG